MGAGTGSLRLTAGGSAPTRRVAQRGSALGSPGADPQASFQHVAIAFDDRVVTVPFVDFRQWPD